MSFYAFPGKSRIYQVMWIKYSFKLCTRVVVISTHSIRFHCGTVFSSGKRFDPVYWREVLCSRKRFSWGIVPGISGALTWIRCWHSPGEMCIKTPSFAKFVLNSLLPQGRVVRLCHLATDAAAGANAPWKWDVGHPPRTSRFVTEWPIYRFGLLE